MEQTTRNHIQGSSRVRGSGRGRPEYNFRILLFESLALNLKIIFVTICTASSVGSTVLYLPKWFVYANGTCILSAVRAKFGHQHRRHLHGLDCWFCLFAVYKR